MNELLKKCREMISSEDSEMIDMGICLLLNNFDYLDCQKVVPFNMFIFSNTTIKNLTAPLNDIVPIKRIYIKGDVCIARYDGKIVCRHIETIKVFWDFNQIEKIYL